MVTQEKRLIQSQIGRTGKEATDREAKLKAKLKIAR